MKLLIHIRNFFWEPLRNVKRTTILVQHLDIDTLIQGNTFRNRRSPYFLDYLNELGIL